MRRVDVRTVTLVTVAALAGAVVATPASAAPAAVPRESAGPLSAGVTQVDTTTASAMIGAALRGGAAGYASTVARTPDGRTLGTLADAEAIRRYWTPERMRRAVPPRAPARSADPGGAAIDPDATPMRTEPRLPSAEALAEAARAAGAEITPAAAASRTVGKVFFIDPIDGREHVCSGATVSSTKGRLVATAGHCVHNGVWMLGWIFAPQYNNGLHPVYGQRVDTLGYPAAAPYNGLTQQSCSGPTYQGVDLGQIGTGPCSFTAGASGSPMLLAYGGLGAGLGYVNSVDANIYTPRPNEIFGPYFDDVNAGLFYYAEAISP